MKLDEIKKAMTLLGGLFPMQINDTQGPWLRTELEPFGLEAATAAIKAHRSSHQFIEWPQLFEGIRAAERDEQATTDNARREGTWFDVKRRQNPQLANASNFAVALRVKRSEWVMAQRHYPSNLDNWREKLDRECRQHLEAAGMDPEISASWAKTIFDPPEHFRRCLAELPASEAQAEQATALFSNSQQPTPASA